MSGVLRVAAVQMCATHNVEANFAKVRKFIQQAKEQNCELVCLPECFDWVKKGTPAEALEHSSSLSDSLFTRYRALAREFGLWISFGGFHERPSPDSTRIRNSHVYVDNFGEIVATYNKTHLFDVNIADGKYNESAAVEPGQHLSLVEGGKLNVGLTICYDVRFPQVYSALRAHGAHLLLVPAAFMPSTGQAHWETLLRARAIENQCFLVAAAQVGSHHETRSSYGHTMIIDPWGKLLAHLDGENEGLAIADLDLAQLHEVRAKMPVASHLRVDLYANPAEVPVQRIRPTDSSISTTQ